MGTHLGALTIGQWQELQDVLFGVRTQICVTPNPVCDRLYVDLPKLGLQYSLPLASWPVARQRVAWLKRHLDALVRRAGGE